MFCLYQSSSGLLQNNALRDFVPFAQFKNMKNTYGGVLLLVTLLNVTLLYGCFSRFLNCTNATKSRKVSPIMHFSFLTLQSTMPPMFMELRT